MYDVRTATTPPLSSEACRDINVIRADYATGELSVSLSGSLTISIATNLYGPMCSKTIYGKGRVLGILYNSSGKELKETLGSIIIIMVIFYIMYMMCVYIY